MGALEPIKIARERTRGCTQGSGEKAPNIFRCSPRAKANEVCAYSTNSAVLLLSLESAAGLAKRTLCVRQ